MVIPRSLSGSDQLGVRTVCAYRTDVKDPISKNDQILWNGQHQARTVRHGMDEKKKKKKKIEKNETLQDLGDPTSTPYMTGLYGHIHVK